MRTEQMDAFEEIMEEVALVTFHQRNKDWGNLVMALFSILKEYELEDIKMAVNRHLQAEKFFPTPADIVKQIRGTPETRAMASWVTVMNAIRRLGSHNSVAFPHPAYNFAFMQLGGWIEFVRSLRDDTLDYRAKTFERLFALGDTRSSWEDEPGKICVERYCMGSHEVNNRKGGFPLPEIFDAVSFKPIPNFRDNHPAVERRDNTTKISEISGNNFLMAGELALRTVEKINETH